MMKKSKWQIKTDYLMLQKCLSYLRLRYAYPALVTGLASELCSIADILWLRGKVDAEEFDFYRADRLSKGFEYGLQ